MYPRFPHKTCLPMLTAGVSLSLSFKIKSVLPWFERLCVQRSASTPLTGIYHIHNFNVLLKNLTSSAYQILLNFSTDFFVTSGRYYFF